LAVPSARVSHDYYLSMHPEKLFLLERGRALLLQSHLSPLTRLLLSPVLFATSAAVLMLCAVRGPRFLRAKLRAWRWMNSNRDAASAWRSQVERFRVVGDRKLLAGLAWGYPVRQLIGVGSERASKVRRPLEKDQNQ
jgi:hypothetical protein